MSRLELLAIAVVGFLAARSHAQTVQLPTFHQFSASTTVLVPDRGGASLGGARRSASGSNQFGAPGRRGNRASGSAVDAGGLSVSAQIHDFEAMDRVGVPPLGGDRQPPKGGTPTYPPSLAEIRRRKAVEPKPAADDAQSLIARADEARAAGKLGVARVYLQMAARRATGPLRDEALAKYHAFGKSQALNSKSQTNPNFK